MFEIREEFKKAHPDLMERINNDNYSFLYENEHLGDRIILLTLGGSFSYGLNNKDSDLDIRGIALHSKEELLGTSNFEQFINNETDTVIYSISKFISLASQCNPNIIEILGCRNEDYLYISPLGQLLLDNKDLFLSQRAIDNFSAFAYAQLKRIRSATIRDRIDADELNKYLISSLQSAYANLETQLELDKYGKFNLFYDDIDKEIKVDVNFNKLPQNEIISIANCLKQVKENYTKTMGKNKRKDDAHLNKHCMHLYRLLCMGLELCLDNTINVYRKDREFLLKIRSGYYMNSDGLIDEKFYELVDNKFKEIEENRASCILPKKPNQKLIENLLIKINEETLRL